MVWGPIGIRVMEGARAIAMATAGGLRDAVQPAFAFESEKAGVLGVHARLPAMAGMDVADRYVALAPQRVVRQAMAREVVTDIAIGPVGQRMELPAAVAMLGKVDRRAAARLAPAQAGKPAGGAQLTQRALHRLD